MTDKFYVMGAGTTFTDMFNAYHIPDAIKGEVVSLYEFDLKLRDNTKGVFHKTFEEAELEANKMINDLPEYRGFFVVIFNGPTLYAMISSTGTKTFEVL